MKPIYHTPDQQELFDTVAEALLKQGCSSINAAGTCVYRSPDGHKCAAGFLIPDELYDSRMEFQSFGSLLNDPLFVGVLSFLEPHKGLITDLQIVHDEWSGQDNPELWRTGIVKGLKVVSARWNLSPSVLNKEITQ